MQMKTAWVNNNWHLNRVKWWSAMPKGSEHNIITLKRRKTTKESIKLMKARILPLLTNDRKSWRKHVNSDIEANAVYNTETVFIEIIIWKLWQKLNKNKQINDKSQNLYKQFSYSLAQNANIPHHFLSGPALEKSRLNTLWANIFNFTEIFITIG